jgi:hypothetical protein
MPPPCRMGRSTDSHHLTAFSKERYDGMHRDIAPQRQSPGNCSGVAITQREGDLECKYLCNNGLYCSQYQRRRAKWHQTRPEKPRSHSQVRRVVQRRVTGAWHWRLIPPRRMTLFRLQGRDGRARTSVQCVIA